VTMTTLPLTLLERVRMGLLEKAREESLRAG